MVFRSQLNIHTKYNIETFQTWKQKTLNKYFCNPNTWDTYCKSNFRTNSDSNLKNPLQKKSRQNIELNIY